MILHAVPRVDVDRARHLCAGRPLEVVLRFEAKVQVAGDAGCVTKRHAFCPADLHVAPDLRAQLQGVAAEEDVAGHRATDDPVLRDHRDVAAHHPVRCQRHAFADLVHAALHLTVDAGVLDEAVQAALDRAGDLQVAGHDVDAAPHGAADRHAFCTDDEIAVDHAIDVGDVTAQEHRLLDDLGGGDLGVLVDTYDEALRGLGAAGERCHQHQRSGAVDVPIPRADPESQDGGDASDHADRRGELQGSRRAIAQHEDQVEGHFVGSLEAQGVE